MSAGWSGSLTDYDPLMYDLADWMYEPQIVNGEDLTQGGAGWSVVDTTGIQSSTANDTLTYVGTCCAFGTLSNNGVGAGTYAYSIDGGAETQLVLSNLAAVNQVANFERGEHTIVIRVVSGLVKISELWAI